MKIFELKNKALNSRDGEYIIGFEETKSHACYMIYGILRPGEKNRVIKPGVGHEEIVLIVKGDVEVEGYYSGTLKEGTAFHIVGDHECFLENKGMSDAIYVIAGGHSEGGHH
ncbi:hypothetical protein JZK55_16930 [Dissulfurispira thermophila]|uniref:Cupin 2 conserved barrel domain-containing protein n=2 Tax=root TaxID=1 RepID=A0A7G1H3P0_9BACT|nr:hypothetical protein [Dissulfurispira thermophila]BCB96771.1 hypothetical protein JZK55_16930 [Dissulfurispira thermophila]